MTPGLHSLGALWKHEVEIGGASQELSAFSSSSLSPFSHTEGIYSERTHVVKSAQRAAPLWRVGKTWNVTSVFIEVCRKTGKSESWWQRSFTRRKVDGIFHTSRSPNTRFTDNHPWRDVITAGSCTWLCITTEVYPSTTNFCHFLRSHEGLS